MIQISKEAIKEFNANELKSELAKQGLTGKGKKEVLVKCQTIQEESDKPLSESLVKGLVPPDRSQSGLQVFKEN